ncbi:TPA: hypothetical protein RZK50_000444 [Campylobacter coli]|nr:hypothetical protein [Campylobacter coli]
MGLKDNLKAVKAEINTEEQFIENFIKGERFIRKYKLYIFTLIAILIVWFAISFIGGKIDQYNVEESNKIYTNLLKNPNDKVLLEQLKNKNTNLYAIFLMKELAKDINNTEIKGQLQTLSTHSDTNHLLKNIASLSLGEKSIFLKNYDKILQAYRLLGEGKIEQANILLSQIKDDSALSQIAKNLKHYQGISQ